MQPYLYNENNQTENILPLLLATSTRGFISSGTVIMPQIGTESTSVYPMSDVSFEKRFRLIDYSLPQISYTFNTQDVFIGGAKASTFYTREEKDEIIDAETEGLSQKFIKLFNILGKRLFSKLNYVQLLFMANTAGVVDLGQSVSLQRMYGYIDQK